MKQMVVYRLAEGTTPIFISDGGYFLNNDLLDIWSFLQSPMNEKDYLRCFYRQIKLLNN
jgi:hypothetical protein